MVISTQMLASTEHLNKTIKKREEKTNLGDDRFHQINRNTRFRQFIYTDDMFCTDYEWKCSACNDVGHNKKNKACPLYPSRIEIPLPGDEEELT